MFVPLPYVVVVALTPELLNVIELILPVGSDRVPVTVRLESVVLELK